MPDEVIPDGLPLGTNQVSGLPEGSKVIAMWSGSNGPHEYVVHREGGRIYARSPSDVTDGVFDREKVLTFVSRVWLPKP
ncbi:MAG TPA: hypothetical protein VIR57_05430 [Chloroflexota bacterium]|jgi:hypothetical protein